MIIRQMEPVDWPAVEAIYRDGIDSGNATFESETPSRKHFDESRVPDPRLLSTTDDGTVVGWVAASPVSTRHVYRGVIEHSIYIASNSRGAGLALPLLTAFIDAAETAGFWTIQSSIFPENAASLALHDRAGFRRVGRRDRIAFMTYGPWAGQWRDTVLVEHRLAPGREKIHSRSVPT